MVHSVALSSSARWRSEKPLVAQRKRSEPAVQLLGGTALGEVAGDVIGGSQDLGGGAAHRDTTTRPAQHLDVVVAVAEGEDVLRRDPVPLAGNLEPGGLVDALRRDVQPAFPAHEVALSLIHI